MWHPSLPAHQRLSECEFIAVEFLAKAFNEAGEHLAGYRITITAHMSGCGALPLAPFGVIDDGDIDGVAVFRAALAARSRLAYVDLDIGSTAAATPAGYSNPAQRELTFDRDADIEN